MAVQGYVFDARHHSVDKTVSQGSYSLRFFVNLGESEFGGWNWSFVAELGGLELKPGEKRSLRWTIPEKFDPARGLAAAGVRGPPEPAR